MGEGGPDRSLGCPRERSQVRTGGCIAIVALVGLLSRAPWPVIESHVPKGVGDVLYAVLFYELFVFVWRRLPTVWAALITWLFTAAVEFSKRCHWPVLEAARHARFGGLLLGHTFLWSDLICYALGVLIAVAMERAVQSAPVTS